MRFYNGGYPRGFSIVCGVWFIASLTVRSLPGSEYLLFLLLVTGGVWFAVFLWTIVPAIAIFLAINRIVTRQYRSAAGWLMVPAAGVLVYFLGTDVGDIIRFRLNKASYDRIASDAIAGKCAQDGHVYRSVAIDAIDCHPVTIIFPWGGFLSIWHGVVYDAEDQIIKPARDRSAAWKNREIGALLSCSGADLTLGDHYYRASGDYTSGTDDCD